MAVGGSGSTYSSDDIVIKSPTDRRLYRYIRLNNGLCALLIHDPDIYDSIANGAAADEEQQLDDDEEEYSEDDDDDDDDGDESEEDDKGKQGASQTKKVI